MARLDIPGPIKSLNVSNAAAVALYTLYWARVAE
jgi:tRNA G18 (ribose-2'-O)-methylase SpoU